MDVTPLIPKGKQVIDAYGDGGFRVSGTRVEGSVIVYPDRLSPWPPVALAEVTASALEEILAAGRAGQVELLLLGTGARMAQVDRSLRQELRAAGVVVEVMDTGAACRTYNVLLAEGRKVAAALIAVA
jgi:uncharacterized protein